jgi:hypothetical protein
MSDLLRNRFVLVIEKDKKQIKCNDSTHLFIYICMYKYRIEELIKPEVLLFYNWLQAVNYELYMIRKELILLDEDFMEELMLLDE